MPLLLSVGIESGELTSRKLFHERCFSLPKLSQMACQYKGATLRRETSLNEKAVHDPSSVSQLLPLGGLSSVEDVSWTALEDVVA